MSAWGAMRWLPQASVARGTRACAEKVLYRAAHVMAPRNKVVSLVDAVALVNSGDTISTSGFVAQGSPEALLEGLGQRFQETGEPANLTVLFGGGPGDWDQRGLNHLGQEDMLRRAIGSHYGQTPKIADLVLSNKIEGYAFPLGAISRTFHQVAQGGPGYLTSVGVDTFVDPVNGGGKLNDITTADLVETIELNGRRLLLYKPIPINVAFVRATTSDSDGNLTMEHESMIGDTRQIAMAAKNSGGVVIAQVKRIAESRTIDPRKVDVPGVLVDCVVQVAEDDHNTLHAQSYFSIHNPAWSHEVRAPMESLKPLEMSARKIIARRAALELESSDTVNLGIGMPEGIAGVAAEERVLQHFTLTTEAGLIGGVGAGGHNFGAATNPDALQEMSQQFDLYNGGGLNKAFLGLAQVSKGGDVNVSRLSPTRLTGPGGFIDITQPTAKVIFMGTFTAKGLEIRIANGQVQIVKEGSVKKFVDKVGEITFSGNRAAESGQDVLYITERGVFERSGHEDLLELIEVAPGIDIERDIFPNMDFEPIISPNLKIMDPTIFKDEPMNLADALFGTNFKDRVQYDPEAHSLFIDLTCLQVTTEDDVTEMESVMSAFLDEKIAAAGGRKVYVTASYDGFDCRDDIADSYYAMTQRLEEKYYGGVRRYAGKAFSRMRLAAALELDRNEDVWKKFAPNGEVAVSPKQIRRALTDHYHINATDAQMYELTKHKNSEGLVPKNKLLSAFRHLRS